MISLMITLIILLIVFGLLWWVISLIPLPPGFPVWVLQVLLALILVLVLIRLLFGLPDLGGMPLLR